MTTRTRTRRIAIWTCALLCAALIGYCGLYSRMVGQMRLVMVTGGAPVFVMTTEPTYTFPWPVPSQYNHASLQPILTTAFAPVHKVDRWLRPQTWTEPQNVTINTLTSGNGASPQSIFINSGQIDILPSR